MKDEFVSRDGQTTDRDSVDGYPCITIIRRMELRLLRTSMRMTSFKRSRGFRGGCIGLRGCRGGGFVVHEVTDEEGYSCKDRAEGTVHDLNEVPR